MLQILGITTVGLGHWPLDNSMHYLRIVEDTEQFHNNIWRHQDCLVVCEDSIFPSKCIRCGEPSEEKFVPKWLFWHTPILLPVVLVSWPFYLVLALIIRKHMMIQIPLCQRHLLQRRWYTILGVGLLPVALSFGVVAIVQSIPVLILGALLTVISSAILLGWARNPVWAIRFEQDLALIQNVHPSIVSMPSMPEWTHDDEYSVKR